MNNVYSYTFIIFVELQKTANLENEHVSFVYL